MRMQILNYFVDELTSDPCKLPPDRVLLPHKCFEYEDLAAMPPSGGVATK